MYQFSVFPLDLKAEKYVKESYAGINNNKEQGQNHLLAEGGQFFEGFTDSVFSDISNVRKLIFQEIPFQFGDFLQEHKSPFPD